MTASSPSRLPQKEAAFRCVIDDLALEFRQIFRKSEEYQIDVGHALYSIGDSGQLRLAVRGNDDALSFFTGVEMIKPPRDHQHSSRVRDILIPKAPDILDLTLGRIRDREVGARDIGVAHRE